MESQPTMGEQFMLKAENLTNLCHLVVLGDAGVSSGDKGWGNEKSGGKKGREVKGGPKVCSAAITWWGRDPIPRLLGGGRRLEARSGKLGG